MKINYRTDLKGNQKYHIGHTNDISAFAIDQSKSIVATGDMCSPGQKPIIRIWSALSGELIIEINSEKGHMLEKQIKALDFSPDGTKLVAVGDDSNHSMCLMESTNGWNSFKKVYNQTTSTADILFATFLDNSSFYLGGSKIMYLYQTNSTEAKKCLFGKCPQDTLVCGLSFNNQLIVGTQGGSVYVVNGNQISDTTKSHTKPVTCLALFQQGFISGGMDKLLVVWNRECSPQYSYNSDECLKYINNVENTRVGGTNGIDVRGNKIVVGTKKCNIFEITVNDKTIKSAVMVAEGHSACEVWGCSANPCDPSTIVSVGDDKEMYLWDIRTKLPRKIFHLPGSSRCIDFHPTDGILAIGLNGGDGKTDCGGFMVINIKTLSTIILVKKISAKNVTSIKYSPDGKYLAVGSKDSSLYMYDVKNRYTLLYKFAKGASFVSQCDFSTDNGIIRVCYGDYQLLYCNVGTGDQVLDASAIAKKSWHTENSIIGWSVQGIWGNTGDKSDINACAADPKKKLIVGVDDFNTVRLYRYPCSKKEAQYKSFCGHSSHIPYAEFTFDGKGLVTCGGNDHTVIYWKVA